MIIVRKPLKELKEMLQKEGFNSEDPSVHIIWKVFKKFSDLKFEVADDALLFQCGTFNSTGKDLFYWDLVRQFCFEEDGEYDHMEQIHIEFTFAPSEDLVVLQDTVWTYDFESFDEFFEKVNKLESFNNPWKKYRPIEVNIFQEQV